MYVRGRRGLGARSLVTTDTGETLWFEEFDPGGVVLNSPDVPPTNGGPPTASDTPTSVVVPLVPPTGSGSTTLLSIRPGGVILPFTSAPPAAQPLRLVDYIPWIAGGLALAFLARGR